MEIVNIAVSPSLDGGQTITITYRRPSEAETMSQIAAVYAALVTGKLRLAKTSPASPRPRP